MTENELATRAAIVDVSGLTKVYGSGAAQVRALDAVAPQRASRGSSSL